MAKRNDTPPAPEPDEVDESLILLAEMLLSDHFFDPDQEQVYKQKLSDNRPAGTASVLLEEDTIELPNGACDLRIEALRTWTHFRIGLAHPAFAATVEGTWSFANEALEPDQDQPDRRPGHHRNRRRRNDRGDRGRRPGRRGIRRFHRRPRRRGRRGSAADRRRPDGTAGSDRARPQPREGDRQADRPQAGRRYQPGRPRLAGADAANTAGDHSRRWSAPPVPPSATKP